jgi:glucose-6-phosphate-specific signal transduction histidine kinase
MKGMIIVAVMLTIVAIGVSFYRHRDWKKLLISAAVFGFLAMLAGLGNMTRSVVPLFIAHFVLIVFAWAALLYYIARGKLYWQVVIAPVATLLFFVFLERVLGSGGIVGG